ncbi:TPA: metallophosphoesterase [Aeromonas salmonicida]|nr:metallophosphoesterase [Aeromonas salmonicida]
MKIIHLSDLHIHGSNDDNQALISALEFISKTYTEHILIITGDITDDGSPKQYEKAIGLLNGFKGRIYICPGNHDYGAVGNLYSEERALRFDQYLSIPLEQGGTFRGDCTPVVNIVNDGKSKVMLIALDSNLETSSPFDFACGEIGPLQLQALNTLLSTSSQDMIKVLFFHHHPFMVNDPFMMLKDAEALARTIYGKIDVVLFGHKHEMSQWENRWGTKYILASDNSSDKNYAKEITIDGDVISVAIVPIRTQKMI